ncbi:MAG: S8 family serine peptidase [Candidatus Sericytochromatia bacterium]|nr:S8 family serine peptidase [Candidatus Sericytochromatia bacterium]
MFLKSPRISLGLALTALSLSACQSSLSPLNSSLISNPSLQSQAAVSANKLNNRVLIGYKGQLLPAKVQSLAQQGLKLVRDLPKLQIAVFEGNPNQLRFLSADPQIDFVGTDQSPRRIVGQPQEVATPITRSGDPLKEQQWSLKAVDAEKAWGLTRGSSNIIAAVVDTGVDLNHPDLQANLLEGYNAENPGTPPQDGHFHGTHVAGIIAAVADNGIGVTGIAPGIKILPVRTISNGGVAEVADGIVWAADHGARVINLSLGWDYPTSAVEETIQRAVKYALDKNVVICAALSNDSNNNPSSTPDNLAGKAGFEGVIGVGNVDLYNRRQGAYGNWKSVSSPGTQIMSTLPNGKYGNLTGTSMATPMVTGIVGLMLSQNPGLKNSEVKQRLMSSAIDLGTPGFDDQFGAGRVNAFAVLSNTRLR